MHTFLMEQSDYVALIIIAVLGFGAGIYLGSGLYSPEITQTIKESVGGAQGDLQVVDNKGFSPVNATILGSRLTLTSGCRKIEFSVTDDQAFSIARALEQTTSTRPLTHDIFKEVVENFGIDILALRIERWGEDIYYARMFVQQGSQVLDIDLRPSDAVAIGLRSGTQMLINQTMLDEKGEVVC